MDEQISQTKPNQNTKRAKYLKFALVLDLTQCCVVILYRRFGTTCQSHLHPWVLTRQHGITTRLWPLMMGPIGWPETSIWDYHSTLCKITDDHRSSVHRGRSLKSHRTMYLNALPPSTQLKISSLHGWLSVVFNYNLSC